MKPFLSSVLLSAIAFAGLTVSRSPAAEPDPSAELRKMTGAHTRMVWLRDGGKHPGYWGGDRAKARMWIMGVDTEDGKGIRPILPEAGAYSWFFFVPDGSGIVYSEITGGLKKPDGSIWSGDWEVLYVNWDGTGKRSLGKGIWANGVATDPATGVVWVYVNVGGAKYRVDRLRLDQPEVRELVWDKNLVGRFVVSGDGKYASGVLNSAGTGQTGVFGLPNGNFFPARIGCQPCMMPGNDPYRLFVFHGDHRSGSIFTNPTDLENRTEETVQLDAPMTRGRYEVSQPKWSNNLRFMVVSGPYTPHANDDGIPFPGASGEKYERYFDIVNVAVGKLDESLSHVEQWLQITNDDKGDYLPEIWVDPAASEPAIAVAAAKSTAPKSKMTWPSSREGLVFLWNNADAANQVLDASGKTITFTPEARDAGVIGRYGRMDVDGGAFVVETSAVSGVTEALSRSGRFTLEMTMMPRSGNSGTILSLGPEGKPDLALTAKDGKLYLHLASTASPDGVEVAMARLKDLAPRRLVVSYDAGKVRWFLDGTDPGEATVAHEGFSHWQPGSLILGQAAATSPGWAGELEGIAIFDRALRPEEVLVNTKAFHDRTNGRKPPQRMVVEARLDEVTPNSTPEAIAPYRRLLLVDNYEVLKVTEGICKDSKIAVARWGILDNRVLDLKREKGQVRQLVLEPMADRPELESERSLNDTSDISLPLYYNVQKSP